MGGGGGAGLFKFPAMMPNLNVKCPCQRRNGEMFCSCEWRDSVAERLKRCTKMHRTFPSHALGSKLPPLIGIARMDLGTRLLKAKRNDRGPYTGLHLGPQSDLILHYFFYFITDWLAVGHIRKKCPFFLTNLRQNAGDTPRYCHKIISS